jgi:hypothetical protein
MDDMQMMPASTPGAAAASGFSVRDAVTCAFMATGQTQQTMNSACVAITLWWMVVATNIAVSYVGNVQMMPARTPGAAAASGFSGRDAVTWVAVAAEAAVICVVGYGLNG